MDWASVFLGAFIGIAGVFGIAAVALYPRVRSKYLLWTAARVLCFAVMAVMVLPMGLPDTVLPLETRLIIGEVALALGAACTGPFLATYIEPRIRLGRFRRHLSWIFILGVLAAAATWIGSYFPAAHQMHDLLLLVVTYLLAVGLYVALRAGSRVARYQAVAWMPLIAIGFVAFGYEFLTRGSLPYWPYIVIVGLVLDFIVTATGFADGFLQIKQERDRAVASVMAAEQMTQTDPLTNIANRRGLEQHFERNGRDRPAGIALIDCDHFKRINDSFGHDMGDRVLVALAQSLKGDDLFVARLGGEEFILLIYSDDWQSKAEAARRRMTQAVRVEVPELQHTVTASAGLTAIAPTDTLSCAMKRADQALYAAKEAGRNRSLALTEFRSDNTPLTAVA